jgi:hypothetical protein
MMSFRSVKLGHNFDEFRSETLGHNDEFRSVKFRAQWWQSPMRRFSQIWLSTIYESTKFLILVFMWLLTWTQNIEIFYSILMCEKAWGFFFNLKRFSCFLRSNFSSLILKIIKKKEKEKSLVSTFHLILWLHGTGSHLSENQQDDSWCGYHALDLGITQCDVHRFSVIKTDLRTVGYPTLCNNTHPKLVRCLAIWPRKNPNPITYLGFY